MRVLTGKAVCDGIAIGMLFFYERGRHPILRRLVEDVLSEKLRFQHALKDADGQLLELFKRALSDVGRSDAQIVQIQRTLLEDPDYCGAIMQQIEKDKFCAEYAVERACEKFVKMFIALDDPYMQGRAADVRDVSNRLIAVLTGVSSNTTMPTQGEIIVAADDLAPSETLQLDRKKVLAFITCGGSSTSHTAILASTMEIPAVVGIGNALRADDNGKIVAVDGFGGLVYIEPDERILNILREKKGKEQRRKNLLRGLRGKSSVTRDGRHVHIYANISSVADVEAVWESDAEGIGLFRSEFLFLERGNCPTEDEQFEAYKTVIERMEGRCVVIRTLDVGADKRADYLRIPHEDNPALGCRGIRLCLSRPELFKAQLRAIYRASVFGNVSILLPMITCVEEVVHSRRLMMQACAELDVRACAYLPDVSLGIMIETPAAALISDVLAKEVDFFSIGTNDLIQYTMAVDRQNSTLRSYAEPCPPAVARLIQMTVQNARKVGISVGICGELAADPSLTERFVTYGVDTLSVSPSRVLEVRKSVREIGRVAPRSYI